MTILLTRVFLFALIGIFYLSCSASPRYQSGGKSVPSVTNKSVPSVTKKQKKKSPVEIAKELVKSIKPVSPIEKIEARGPYLNFFISKKIIARNILEIDEDFGKSNLGNKKTIVFDFSHPNIGKPMHVGHIRSTIIGDSMMRTYNYLGYNPVGINYL